MAMSVRLSVRISTTDNSEMNVNKIPQLEENISQKFAIGLDAPHVVFSKKTLSSEALSLEGSTTSSTKEIVNLTAPQIISFI